MSMSDSCKDSDIIVACSELTSMFDAIILSMWESGKRLKFLLNVVYNLKGSFDHIR
jgi:hypothetical protein